MRLPKKYLIIFFLFSFNAISTVKKLNSGTCWLEELPEGAVKVADFNKTSAIEYSADFIKRKIETIQTEMARYGEYPDGIERRNIYFYCSEGGNALVFNFNYENVGICSWAFLGRREKDSRGIEYFSNKSGEEGPCWGYEPGVIFVRLSEESFLNEFYKELNSVRWGDIVEEVEYFSKVTLKIKIYEKLHFREGQIRKKLEKNEKFQKKIKEVFFNHIMRIGGEFHSLKNWSFQGIKK